MVDESIAAEFWKSLSALQPENGWCKPPSSEVTLEGLRQGSTALWEGYLEFQWGWRNQWQRRFVLVGKMIDGLTGYTASGATSWLFHFTDDGPTGKPKGCLHLSYSIANAKLLERKGRMCCALVSLPRNADGSLEDPVEMPFRCCTEEDENELAQFASVCVVTAREENNLARQFVRAFDRETYLDDAVDALPLDLLLFVRSYMRSEMPPRMEVGSSLLEWLHTRLIALIECDGLNRKELCTAAKNVTAFIGSVAWTLFSSTQAPPGAEPRHVWKYISILQQYQLRQLVESAVFDDEAPDWMAHHATSMKGAELFEVVHKHGVAFRSSPCFEDRIRRYDGPECGTKFQGVLVKGMDNRSYVRSCASPRGFLPLTDTGGNCVLRRSNEGTEGEDSEDFSQFKSPDHLWRPKPRTSTDSSTAWTWSQLLLRWTMELPKVLNLQERWDDMRERFTQNDDFLQECWAKRLQKLHPDRFNTAEQFVGMLTPALEMVLAMGKCTTPVQKVRLWTESILQAASLINTFLPNGEVIGGEDLPSLVLFLTCHAECESLAAQVEFGSLFIIDPDGEDRTEFGLHPDSGFPERLPDQIVLDAEHRFISPYHYFAWVGDALDVVTTNEEGCISPRRSMSDSPLSPRSPMSYGECDLVASPTIQETIEGASAEGDVAADYVKWRERHLHEPESPDTWAKAAGRWEPTVCDKMEVVPETREVAQHTEAAPSASEEGELIAEAEAPTVAPCTATQ